MLSEQPSILQAYLPFLSTPRLVEKCRQVYFSTEDYSDATFIVVNGALLYLISDVVAITKDSQTREEYDKYLNLCLVNLETALGSLNLLMPANDENIEALALGVSFVVADKHFQTADRSPGRLCNRDVEAVVRDDVNFSGLPLMPNTRIPSIKPFRKRQQALAWEYTILDSLCLGQSGFPPSGTRVNHPGL